MLAFRLPAAATKLNSMGGPGGWAFELQAKHNMPLNQIPGHVYVLHYEIPQIVRSVSIDYAGRFLRSDEHGLLSAKPIRHYVGWTQQKYPRKRINRHGPAALREIVYLEAGTTLDEQAMKETASCPTCDEPLRHSLAATMRKSVYEITYPNGKIFIGLDLTDSTWLFGVPRMKERWVAELGDAADDYTARRRVLWSSMDASDKEARQVQRQFVADLDANNPDIGYN